MNLNYINKQQREIYGELSMGNNNHSGKEKEVVIMGRWIKVADRPPTKDGFYFCTDIFLLKDRVVVHFKDGIPAAKTFTPELLYWLEEPPVEPIHEANTVQDPEFLKYIDEARDCFCANLNNQKWNWEARTNGENLLIAYDQMKERLRSQPSSIEVIKKAIMVLYDENLFSMEFVDEATNKFLSENPFKAVSTNTVESVNKKDVAKVIAWMCGYNDSDFPSRKENDPPFYWRSILIDQFTTIGVNFYELFKGGATHPVSYPTVLTDEALTMEWTDIMDRLDDFVYDITLQKAIAGHPVVSKICGDLKRWKAKVGNHSEQPLGMVDKKKVASEAWQKCYAICLTFGGIHKAPAELIKHLNSL